MRCMVRILQLVTTGAIRSLSHAVEEASSVGTQLPWTAECLFVTPYRNSVSKVTSMGYTIVSH
jgi:hypothetical protein